MKLGTTKLLSLTDEVKFETIGWSVDSDLISMNSSKTFRININNVAKLKGVLLPFVMIDDTIIIVCIDKKKVSQSSTKMQTLWIPCVPERETWPVELSLSAQLLPIPNAQLLPRTNSFFPITVKNVQTFNSKTWSMLQICTWGKIVSSNSAYLLDNSITIEVNIKIGRQRIPNDNAKWAKLEAVGI